MGDMGGGQNSVATAAIMFVDLVASTELRSRLGEQAADAIRAELEALVAEAVGDAGGHVAKHLGDGSMAVFPSCVQALTAAVTIQQQLDLLNRRRAGERLALRVGVAAGDVTFDADDCHGLAVVEAQRLEASASPGSIWCADVVRFLARGRTDHEFRSVGSVVLKGIPEPLPASELLWRPIRETTPRDESLPPVLAGSGLPFAGRDELFARLMAAWERVVRGGSEVVLLSGEPGAGKTRLAQELARCVQDDAIVLAGRCDDGPTPPFQAFGTALEWFVRRAPPESIPRALGEFPGDLVRLVPHLDDLVEGLPSALNDEPDAERARLFASVESWLSAGGAAHPRLLVLDDLQWADTPTLLLLRRLVASHPAGLMVVGTYRDTDVSRDHPLTVFVADHRQVDSVTRVRVDGLGPEGVRELLERAGGHQLDEVGMQFAERVQRETSGNPFFVAEVLRDLIEDGTIFERRGQWTSEVHVENAGIPDGVSDVVAQRLRRLGEDVERALRSASVIGHEFDAGLLADVLALDTDAVLGLLEAAIAANLVAEVGRDRYRFEHALVRETMRAEFSSSRRAREHRKVALAIEARHPSSPDAVVTQLAHHWSEAAATGDRRHAFELSARAGELAASRGAHENAAIWFGRALGLAAGDAAFAAERRKVSVRLAEVESEVGNSTDARSHALEAAREGIDADDVDTVVSALRVRSRHGFSAIDPDDPERILALRRALEMGSLSAWQRAALLGELAKELIFNRDVESRRDVLAEQGRIVEQLPTTQRALLAATAGATSYVCGSRAALEGRVVDAEAALADVDALTASERWRVFGHLSYLAMHLGDRPLLDRAIAGMGAVRVGVGAVRDSMTLLQESMRAMISGDVAEAEVLADRLVTRLGDLGVAEAVSYRWTTLLAGGRERDSMETYTTLVDELERSGHPAGPERATAALIRFQRGDLDRVRASLNDLDGHEFADDATLQLCLAYWAEIVAGLGSDSHCRSFLDRLADTAGVNLLIGGVYLGPVDRLCGLLHAAVGEYERADERFASASELQASLGSPPWIARTELDWSSTLLARGDRTGARRRLDAARVAIGELDLAESRRRHDRLAAQLTLSR